MPLEIILFAFWWIFFCFVFFLLAVLRAFFLLYFLPAHPRVLKSSGRWNWHFFHQSTQHYFLNPLPQAHGHPNNNSEAYDSLKTISPSRCSAMLCHLVNLNSYGGFFNVYFFFRFLFFFIFFFLFFFVSSTSLPFSFCFVWYFIVSNKRKSLSYTAAHIWLLS